MTTRQTTTYLIIACFVCTAIAAFGPERWVFYAALGAVGFAVAAHVVWTRGLNR